MSAIVMPWRDSGPGQIVCTSVWVTTLAACPAARQAVVEHRRSSVKMGIIISSDVVVLGCFLPITRAWRRVWWRGTIHSSSNNGSYGATLQHITFPGFVTPDLQWVLPSFHALPSLRISRSWELPAASAVADCSGMASTDRQRRHVDKQIGLACHHASSEADNLPATTFHLRVIVLYGGEARSASTGPEAGIGRGRTAAETDVHCRTAETSISSAPRITFAPGHVSSP